MLVPRGVRWLCCSKRPTTGWHTAELLSKIQESLISLVSRPAAAKLDTFCTAAVSVLIINMALLEYVRRTVARIIVRIAWLLSDLFGWRAAMTVYPAIMRGKVAIVTGANSGIGFEATKALLQVSWPWLRGRWGYICFMFLMSPVFTDSQLQQVPVS